MRSRSRQPSPTAAESTGEAIQGEIQGLVRAQHRRRRLFPMALLVGLYAGLVAVAFRFTMAQAESLRGMVAAFMRAHVRGPWGAIGPIAFGALFCGIAVALVRRFAPETSGSGIPHIKAVLHYHRPLRAFRVVIVKFAGGVLGIGGGLALGREGPTIQMGGAVGALVSRWLRTTSRERRTLIAAGAGAGLAAAFNAPLAGLVFVLEEVQRDFTPAVFVATLIASISADVVARWLGGQLPVFHVEVGEAPPIASLPAFLLLGVAAGLLAVAFNRGILLGLDLFDRARRWPVGLAAAGLGAAVGFVAWFAPTAVGTGSSMLEDMLAGRPALGTLIAFFLLRFLLTSLSYGTGAPGGIFAPLLVLGAQLGLMVGDLSRRVLPSVSVPGAAFAVAGMAAYFTGIVRAPLTGIVLIVEMTGRYDLVLALLVACLAAYATADMLGDLPIYERLLARELARGDHREPERPLLVDLSIHEGARWDGREVNDLHLPSGCLLVTVRRAHHDHVPSPEMRLSAGDHLMLLVAPASAPAIGELREQAEGA